VKDKLNSKLQYAITKPILNNKVAELTGTNKQENLQDLSQRGKKLITDYKSKTKTLKISIHKNKNKNS